MWKRSQSCFSRTSAWLWVWLVDEWFGGNSVDGRKTKVGRPWVRTKSKQRENGETIEYSPGVSRLVLSKVVLLSRNKSKRKERRKWWGWLLTPTEMLESRRQYQTGCGKMPEADEEVDSPDFLSSWRQTKGQKSQISLAELFLKPDSGG
jgi:hypothetical protein